MKSLNIKCLIVFYVFAMLPMLACAKESCDQMQALKAVFAEPSVVKFCSGENGCDFRAAKRLDLKNPNMSWLVTISLIHSFNEKGEAQFMPEGAALASVSNTCVVAEIMGPSALFLKKPETAN